jgi:Protein of unknown function (DUF664)
VPRMDLNTMTELPAAGDEIQTLLGVLDRNRRTFAWKCFGLDAAGMNTRLAPSTMTLGGLVKHVALVEDDMFSNRLFGRDPGAPWNAVDWDADPDWEWRTAADDSPQFLRDLFDESVDASNRIIREALDADGLDRLSVKESRRENGHFSLRWIILHMIEEYAQHNGHADLLRESIDGRTGE